MKLNTINIAHGWMKQYIKPGDICIDATAGRGFDTAFLCDLVGEKGKVLAFDIQEEAVESTKLLLKEKGLKAEVYLESHVNMGKYMQPQTVAGIMFNFGYLPGGDHTKSTQPATSQQAIEEGLSLLKQHGVMSLCIYHGGDTGFEEKETLLSYLKKLDGKGYTVAVCELYNKPNHPPLAVLIQKHEK